MTDKPDPAVVAADLEQVGAEGFARLVADASDDQLTEILDGPSRKRVLDEIFGRMAAHVEPERARGTNAVVHFKILHRAEHLGGGYDHYEVVFEDGGCTASDRIERDPQVTIKVGSVNFLKLAANQASGPTLFLTGKLQLEGDVMLASRLTGFFRIPPPADRPDQKEN
jgi:putative sterol carrier protein